MTFVWPMLLLAVAMPAPGSTPIGAAPAPAAAASASRVAIGMGAVIVWVESDVRYVALNPRGELTPSRPPNGSGAAIPSELEDDGRPPAQAAPPAALAVPVLVGDTLGDHATIDVPAAGRVVLLVDGAVLVAVDGPAVVARDETWLALREGRALSVETLGDYREGPLPMLSALMSVEDSPPESGGVGLVLLAPGNTTLREQKPTIRWRWPEGDARFDVTVEAIATGMPDPGDGAAEEPPGVVLERWRGVAGRSLVLRSTLQRGARYRVTVAVSGPRPVVTGLSARGDFAISSLVGEDALVGALAALARLPRGPGFVRPEIEVLRARLLESFGLLVDAERVWAALALLHPDRSELREQARRLNASSRPGGNPPPALRSETATPLTPRSSVP